MKIIPITPIGSHKSLAFVSRMHGKLGASHPDGVHGCGVEEVEVQEFAKEHLDRGEAFRRFRVWLGLSLRQGANALGLSAVDMSSLERGRATLSTEDWQGAHEALRAASSPGGREPEGGR